MVSLYFFFNEEKKSSLCCLCTSYSTMPKDVDKTLDPPQKKTVELVFSMYLGPATERVTKIPYVQLEELLDNFHQSFCL